MSIDRHGQRVVVVEVPTAQLIANDIALSDISSAIAAEVNASPAGLVCRRRDHTTWATSSPFSVDSFWCVTAAGPVLGVGASFAPKIARKMIVLLVLPG